MQEGEDNRKKLLQAEVKIRQLTQATLKDLKTKLREKDAEIDVLKEMVKSSNISAKAKETDLSRLQKKLERYERGGFPSRGREDSSTSRQSKAHKIEPIGNQVIQERDEMLEQTGGDYLYMQQ